jgi:hypothetical protein
VSNGQNGNLPQAATKRKPSQPFSASSDSLGTTGSQSLEELDVPNGEDVRKPDVSSQGGAQKNEEGTRKEPIWLNRVNRIGRGAASKEDAHRPMKGKRTSLFLRMKFYDDTASSKIK